MPLKAINPRTDAEYWRARYGEDPTAPSQIETAQDLLEEPEDEMGNFTRGLNAGVNQTQALGGGLKAAFGSVIGSKSMVDSGMEIYERNMSEADEYAGDVMTVEEIDSVSEAGQWAAYTLGSIVPDLVGAIGTGGIGSVLGKQIVKKGVKDLAEKTATETSQELLKKGVEKDAAEYLAREVAERKALGASSKAAITGGLAGSAAYNAPVMTGGSFASILQETGVESPLTALGVGVVGAGLEAAPFMKAFKSVFPDGSLKNFKEYVAGNISDQPKWVTQAIKDIVSVQGAEMGTEALQYILEESAVTFVNNNYTEAETKEYLDYLSNERKRSGLINNAAAGLLMGTATGVGTAGVKTVKGQYKTDQTNQAGDIRTEMINNDDLRSEVIKIFEEYKDASESGETLLPDPTQADVDALNENPPLTPEERREAGLSELTDYDGTDIVIPEGTEPEAQSPQVVPEEQTTQAPQTDQADIVTDFESAPAFGERSVPEISTESGTVYEYHNFEGQLSDPAKPVADQLVELSVASNTPEALDPNNTDVVIEAIDADDVERIFDRNDSLKIETNEKPSGRSLPTVDESFVDNAQEATDIVGGVISDLSTSGVPKSFLDAVTGIYVHEESEIDVPALTGRKSRGISVNSGLVSGAASDPKQLSELAWSMTHEVYHAADFSMGLSDKDPQFGITIVSERDQPTVVMGDVMDEIFTNWENRTELGKRFDYPFNDLQKEITDRDKSNEGLDKSYRQEVFAQLGAMFHSNPKLLQEQSPLAYNFIKGIRDSNLKTNNVPEVQSEGTSSPSDPDATEPTGLRGQVRAPPESGSIESAPVSDTGSDGEGSTGVGRTDSTVEGQAQENVGERERPEIQEPELTPAEDNRTEVVLKPTKKKPTFKKAENWEDTGNYIVTFEDGDRYTVSIDDNAQEAGEEVYYTSEDGKISDMEGMLGQTQQETINEIQEYRQKLINAGKNSYNVPLDPQVGSDTSSKAYNLITDHPEGKLEITKVRKKFKSLEDNQFDQMIADLVEREGFALEDGVLSDPEMIKLIEEERIAEERLMAEDAEFQRMMDDDLDDPSFILSYKPPRRTKNGKYVGSPAGINTPAKLARIRRFVKSLAEQGEYGRFWYERSGRTILEITGGNVEEAKKIVQAIAITSPSTPVDTNYEYAIQAYYQWKNGQPIETGRFPQSMGDKITKVFNGESWSGRKTNNFEQNLLRAIDDTLDQGVTTDLWMMRAFGYTSDSATDLNYDFVENETVRVAEELGWEPQQVQAAIWVEIKSRMESKPVKAEVDKKSELRGNYKWVTEKGKKIRKFKDLDAEKAHSILWVKTALNYNPTSAERNAAKFDYRDATLNKMAQISVESIPSTKSGHFPEIFNASEGEILEYHHAIEQSFLDDDGVDIVAKELGLLQMGRSQGIGAWEGRNDPVTQNQIILPRQYREKADGIVSDDANDLVAAYAAVYGTLLKQDGIGWHRPFFKKSNTKASQDGMDVTIGRPLNMKETQELAELLEAYGLGGNIVSTQYGVRIINYSDTDGKPYSGLPNFKAGKQVDFKDAIINSVEAMNFDGDLNAEVVGFVSANDLIENDWTENKNGEGYLQGRLRERPDLQRRVSSLITQLQPRIREVEAEFAGTYGWTRNHELNRDFEGEVDEPSFIQKKKKNAKNNTLDDGSPSTSQFTYNDEIDAQSDLGRRLRKGRNRTVRSLSDRYDSLKDFENQAADYLDVGRIPASMSPRDQENLSHGKVQDDLDEFHKTFVDIIGDLIHESGIDPDSVGVYLLAKHAEERNAHVFEREKEQRKKNIARTEKEIERLEDDVEVDHTVAIATQRERLELYKTLPFKFADSGSGMTNSEAQSVLNTAEREGTKDQMEEIASKVYEMLQFQRDRMVEAGLLDEVSRADWEDTFKFYVPLKGFAAEENGDSYVRGSASRGFSVIGSESMKAKGRKTLPVNPLLTAIEDVQKKIIRARKNETAQTLLDLLSNLGNSESYVIYNNKFRPPMESDPLTMQDLKSMSRDRRPNGDPKYVEVKKGGQTFFIYFKSDSLNHSLQNMSVPLLSRANESIGKVLTFATRFQTFRRNMLINYNPSWGLVNPLRDVQTGLMYALSEIDKKGSRTGGKNIIGNMAKQYFPAMRSLYRYYREKPARKDNKLDQYVKDFHDDGAQTGLMLVKDQAEQLRILKSRLKKGFTKDAIRSLLKLVEDFNMTMENSVRLAAYVESRKAGTPREDAATLAKDLTVNFNRKGEDTATVNALYLFFNAAVQGNVNIIQALSNDGSSGKRFTTAQKTVGGLVALGSSLALMNILNSEDDDDGDKQYEDLPEHAKNRSLLIMSPDGEEGFALPAPYGYNFFTNIGRYTTELATGVTTFDQVAVNMFDNVLLNFVPITPSQGEGWAENVRGFYPDLLQLHLDLLANKNYFGGEIFVEQNPLFVKRSQSYLAKKATGKNFKEITKFLNDATGGDEFEDGMVNISPDKMQFVFNYLFGGFGRSVSQTGDVINKMLADEEVRRQDIPVSSTFFKIPSEYEDRFEYYDNWDEVWQMRTQLKQTDITDTKEVNRLIGKFGEFAKIQKGEVLPVLGMKGTANLFDLSNAQINQNTRERKLVTKSPASEEKKKKRIDELDALDAKVFDIFNRAYRKSERQTNK